MNTSRPLFRVISPQGEAGTPQAQAEGGPPDPNRVPLPATSPPVDSATLQMAMYLRQIGTEFGKLTGNDPT